MAPGHVTHGVLFGLAAAPFAPQPNGPVLSAVIFTAVSAFGALVPDLDLPGSRLTRAGGFVTHALHRVLLGLSIAVYDATATRYDRPVGNGHRTLTHTPVFTAVLALVVFAGLRAAPATRGDAELVALGLFVGQFAHLVGDSCTHAGIPWLWPLKCWGRGRRWAHHGIPKWMRFTTGGSVGEPVMTWVSTVLCVAVPAFYLYEGIGL